MAEKVTTMVLKVDLQCPCCYKKIKKILCKFPQIRDQVYDEKGNTVTITVVCCSPEKIRDKLCCKGGKVIKSIEIKEPKPKEPEKKKDSEKPKPPEKPKEPEKPKDPEKPKVIVVEKPKEPEKAKVVVVEKPKEPEKPKSNGKGSDAAAAEKPKEVPKPNPPPPEPVKVAVPVNGFPPVFPAMPCCGPCHNDGYGGWPCYNGYGVPPPPQPCYDGYYGYDQYGRSYHVSRCDSYFSEENPSACLIM